LKLTYDNDPKKVHEYKIFLLGQGEKDKDAVCCGHDDKVLVKNFWFSSLSETIVAG